MPPFQFGENGSLVPGIEAVVRELDPKLHPVAVMRWFAAPNPDLATEEGETSLTPLEWLKAGNSPEPVAQLASDL